MRTPAPVNTALVSRYVQRYAEYNMTAGVRIMRMTDVLFGSDTGVVEAQESELVYEGPARVYTISGPSTYNLGEEPQYFSGSYVTVPITADPVPMVDDVVEVLTHLDPAVVGRRFRVMDVESGGQYPGYRRLQVTGVQSSKQWDHPSRRRIRKEWLV